VGELASYRRGVEALTVYIKPSTVWIRNQFLEVEKIVKESENELFGVASKNFGVQSPNANLNRA